MEPKEILAETTGKFTKENAGFIMNIVSQINPYLGLEKKAVDTYLNDIQQSNLPQKKKR